MPLNINALLAPATIALLAAGQGDALAANRCVGLDGQVTFQDAPCPNTAKNATPIKLRENTVSNGIGRPAAPEKLTFGTNRYENVVIAGGAMEVLATNGRECRIELKVRPESEEAINSCNRYS